MGTRFTDRRVLVTGASRGIGAALATRFAAEAARVAIVARTLDRHDHLAGSLSETAARMEGVGGKVAVIVADLADGDDRQRIVPEAEAALGGPVEILVNNAAAAIYAPTSVYPLKRRRITFEVNVHAPLDLAQAVVPGMVERGEGWIVNVSSASAKLSEGPPFRREGVALTLGIYGASKAALNRETNCLAAELHGTGVRINTIEPRAAVMSEGANELVGGMLGDDQIESMESMVEATLALCDCGPDFTGRVTVSTELIDELGLTVMTLDGSGPAPA
jgi:NAD(P)-dependent dehydrogenase (short-subunit alcohol dehydrogenase family)